jgi:hypothetical protein
MQVDHQPDTIDFTIATLNQPDAVAPGFHTWRRSKVAWLDTADQLPRFEEFRPHTPGPVDPGSGFIATETNRRAAANGLSLRGYA